MKLLRIFVAVLLTGCAAIAQGGAPTLDSVLASMDNAAARFHTAQANFKWDQFESAVNERDIQSGTIFIQRSGGKLQMMAHVTDPANAEKYALYNGSTVQLFDVTPNRKTEYNAGNNKETFETFLVLGFGGGGHELQKSFEVKLDGTEAVDGVNTARLLLTPRSQKVRNVFERIYLWIDPGRGIALRQKFLEPQTGNYRDAVYTNIKLNAPLPGDAFKLPTNNKTQTVKPQG